MVVGKGVVVVVVAVIEVVVLVVVVVVVVAVVVVTQREREREKDRERERERERETPRPELAGAQEIQGKCLRKFEGTPTSRIQLEPYDTFCARDRIIPPPHNPTSRSNM